MSGLAAQLQRLAGKSSASFQATKRVSLLFTASEAARLTIDDVYDVALNGFLQLRNIDVRFSPFAETLFSVKWKQVEREAQDEDFNAQLDALIDAFMRRLSPHFMQRCAHKALEYLLWRFRVHHHNATSLIRCVLPFHESTTFARVMRFTRISAAGAFRVLKAVQKSGAPLPRGVLVERCTMQTELYQFICDAVLAAQQHGVRNAPLLALYFTVTTDMLRAMRGGREDVLRILLPVLLGGLSSSDADFRYACLMVVAQLCSLARLSKSLISKVLPMLCPRDSRDADSLLCLVLVCQTQQLTHLPENVLCALWESETLLAEVRQLGEAFDVEGLLRLLFRGFVSYAWEENEVKQWWDNANKYLDLSPALLSRFVTLIMQHLPSQAESAEQFNAYCEAFCGVLRSLDARDPSVIGVGVEQTLSDKPDTQSAVAHLLRMAFPRGSQHQLQESGSTTLYLALQHSSETVRQLALSDLDGLVQRHLQSQQEGESGEDDTRGVLAFAADAVVQLLHDDSSAIVHSTLKLAWIARVVPPARLLPPLRRLIESAPSSKIRSRATLLLLRRVAPEAKARDAEGARSVFEEIVQLALCALVRIDNRMLVISSSVCSALAGVDSPLFAHLGSLQRQLPATTPAGKARKKKRKKSKHQTAAGTASPGASDASESDLSVAGLAKALASGVKEDVQRLWPVVVGAALPDAFLLLVGRALLLEASAAQAPPVISTCLSMLRRHLGSTRSSVVAAAESTSWNRKWCKMTKQGTVSYALFCEMLRCVMSALGADASDEQLRALWYLLAHKLPPNVLQRFFRLTAARTWAFLASCWNDEQEVELVRVQSIRMGCLVLRGAQAANQALPVDLLVALLLPALQCDSRDMRCAALDALRVARRAVKDEEKAGQRLASDTDGSALTYYDAESTEQLTPLDSATLRSLLDALQAARQELSESATEVLHLLKIKYGKGDGKVAGALQVLQWLASHLRCNVECDNRFAARALARYVLSVDHRQRGEVVLPVLQECPTDIVVELLPMWAHTKNLRGLVSSAAQWNAVRAFMSSDDVAVQTAALSLISRTFWSALKQKQKQQVFEVMCEVAARHEEASLRSLVRRAAADLQFPSKVVAPLLLRAGGSTGDKGGKSPKRSKREQAQGSDLLLLEVALDLLRGAVPERDLALSDLLLKLLQRMLEVADGSSSFEHIVHMIVSTLASVMKPVFHTQRGGGKKGGALPDLELGTLVQCLRVTHNQHTINEVLLLLSMVAVCAPEAALSHVVPIFTFMGSSSLQVDDSTSFSVVQQVLSKILPIIARTQATQVMSIFAASFPTIPAHRRMTLYRSLLQHLPKGSLPTLMEQLLPHQQDTVFLRSLLMEVGALEATRALLAQASAERLEPAFAELLAAALVDDEYMEQLMALSDVEEQEVQQLFVDIFRKTLEHVNAEEAASVDADGQRAAAAGDEEEERLSLLEYLYDVLDTLNQLFSVPHFLQSVRSLLTHRNAVIRQRALSILNEKTSALRSYLTSEEEEQFMALLPEVLAVVRSPESAATLKQTAVLSLEILARNFGAQHVEQMMEVARELQRVLSDVRDQRDAGGEVPLELACSLMLTLATFCTELGPAMVALVSPFVELLLHFLSAQYAGVAQEQLLTYTAVSAVAAVVASQWRFITPHVKDMLLVLYGRRVALQTQCAARVSEVYKCIAKRVPLRLLLPILYDTFEAAVRDSARLASSRCVKMVGRLSKRLSAAQLEMYHESIWEFLQKALVVEVGAEDAAHSEEDSGDDGDDATAADCSVQRAALSSFAKLVVQFNEVQFRPLYLGTIEWCFAEGAKRVERLVAYCRLSTAFVQHLKSIFVPYFSHVWKRFVVLLQQCHTPDSTISAARLHDLRVSSVELLRNLFHYDTEAAIDKDAFAALIDPLVDLLDLAVATPVEADSSSEEDEEDEVHYAALVADSVVPCIANMALAMGSDTLWKPLNRAVLLKTRTENSMVRLACLDVLHLFFEKLGEEWLLLLPETLQFLGELMEDDEPAVESSCQRLLRTINGYLPPGQGIEF